MAAWKQRQLLKEGARAPDFRLPRLDGDETPLAGIVTGGPALVAFFKVTCPVCQLTFPFLGRIHSPALAVCGISQNDAADTREFNREFGVAFPVLLDSEDSGYPVSNAFGISSVPTMFLVEKDGSVSRVIEGWRKREIEWLGEKAGVKPFRPSDYVPEWKAG
jgi:peroxiredoxin